MLICPCHVILPASGSSSFLFLTALTNVFFLCVHVGIEFQIFVLFFQGELNVKQHITLNNMPVTHSLCSSNSHTYSMYRNTGTQSCFVSDLCVSAQFLGFFPRLLASGINIRLRWLDHELLGLNTGIHRVQNVHFCVVKSNESWCLPDSSKITARVCFFFTILLIHLNTDVTIGHIDNLTRTKEHVSNP